ncbi:hypothetical protein OIU93_00695 [Paeniglutamicibacter sp. ZC-3]|uniref:hypothetical protein n=1 Tax=Paeniglutamicibacter sp. ZC-3 TaxID=2986919 RepID=UPI0021F6D495|nr:hypothetical protein [Paeniglutamicibacter sp. ZC-3]MCV9992811.1 hypothetical protein [Paeniglutamicibacter sp. ZC-3]
MVNGFALLLLLGFSVGIVLLVRRNIVTQKRSDLLSLAASGTFVERANAGRVLRSLRARTAAALAVMALGGAVALVLHAEYPGAAGLPLAAAPACMWILASLVFVAWRLPHEFSDISPESSLHTSAELTPRSTGNVRPGMGDRDAGCAARGIGRGSHPCRDPVGTGRAGALPQPPVCIGRRRGT